MASSDYSDLSVKLTKILTKQTKKHDGIFFTPRSIIQDCIKSITQYLHRGSTILEPSCGSGEFINALNKLEFDFIIDGIEYNKIVYDGVKNIETATTTITRADFIGHIFETKYDIIIGNPPYFVLKKDEVDSEYNKYFDGRPNVFILFIIKSLSLLNSCGVLCFVLPKNFLNCLYYDKTRKHIVNNYTILNIFESVGEFIETQQDTVVVVIQNKPPIQDISSFTTTIDKTTIFGTADTIANIRRLVKNSTTLYTLGFSTSIGKIVWNQKKSILTDDNTCTRLIYSSDIKLGTVGIESYKNSDKKNYINCPGVSGKMILVNRGYGVGSYKFEYAIYESSSQFLIENHIICITGIDNGTFEKIITSFNDPRTKEFIKYYFSNNAINSTELSSIMPIYLTSDI